MTYSLYTRLPGAWELLQADEPSFDLAASFAEVVGAARALGLGLPQVTIFPQLNLDARETYYPVYVKRGADTTGYLEFIGENPDEAWAYMMTVRAQPTMTRAAQHQVQGWPPATWQEEA